MQTPAMKLKSLFGALALLASAGCVSVPPGRIDADRMDYALVIADSWKRQTLLNVVRLRYADAPVFLDVASVINSYSMTGKVNAGASLPSQEPNTLNLGAEGTWSNTPTVTYQPLLGDRFTRSLLQPIPPSAVFQLLQGGWPADLVMRSVVRSVNGLRNDALGVAADPGFYRMIELLLRIQRAGNFGIRVEPRKDGGAVVIVLRPGGTDTRLHEDERHLRKLLGLDESAGEYEITYGLLPRSGREVAMITRSMLELFMELGHGIELPATHVTEGRATPGRRQEGDVAAAALVRIRSGIEAPTDSHVAVRYKNHWYWIDDHDVRSKSIFTFLLILSSLAETGQGAAAPVVTVPSR